MPLRELTLLACALAGLCPPSGPALAQGDGAEGPPAPSRVWRDLYSEVFAWDRASGAPATRDAVPTLRLRAGYRLPLDLDLGPYLVAQATRDVSSTGAGAGGVPEIYADDRAILGAGLLLRLWERRLILFVQAGTAQALVDDGRPRSAFDARGGAALGLETPGCAPAAGEDVAGPIPCAELYSEVVYLSRFADNVVALARGRLAATWAVTGSVAWQLAAELRAGADRNGDYYNNFVDAGIGPRLRLLRPFRLDVFPGFHAGTYLGRSARDPAPHPLGYGDLRLQIATSLEF